MVRKFQLSSEMTTINALTCDDKKEIALLVASGRISARTAERAIGMRGDGAGLLYHAKMWEHHDIESEGSVALQDEYEKKWTARYPELSGQVSAPVPLAVPAGPIVPEKLSNTKAKVKRAAQLSAIAFHKSMNEGNTSMTWVEACRMTLKAFRDKSYDIKKLNPKSTKRLAKKLDGTDSKSVACQGRKALIPKAIEDDLAFVVTHLRENNIQVRKPSIKKWINQTLLALGSANPFPKGVTDMWYYGWCQRYEMNSKNETALDQRRAKWMTASNLFKAFYNLFDVVVKFGCATKNPEFINEMETPNINPIEWIDSELWRVIEFDECGLDLGIKTDSASKTSGERTVGPKGINYSVLREGVPHHHISAMMAINLKKETLLSGFVFDLGEHAHLKTEYLTDDDGNLLKIPLTNPEGTVTEHVPAFVASNTKGSFDGELLIGYMKAMVYNLLRLHRKEFTAEKPGIFFIDGCQTHITAKVLKWCTSNHIELVIKLPYGTSKTQSMDAKGGHFAMIQPAYRNNLRHRTIQLLVAWKNAKTRKERESGMAAQKGDLKMSDFIPCIKQPWLESCTYERHERALNTVGLVPPTMRPAYEQLRKEQEKKARVEQEASERAISEQQLSAASKALRQQIIDYLAPVSKKRKRDEPIDADSATGAATGAATTNPGLTTAEAAGDFAAREVVKNYVGVLDSEKRKIRAIVKKNGNKWKRLQSGEVWSKFNGYATAPAYTMYQSAIEAYDAAAEQFKRRKRARAAEKVRKKEAEEVPVADDAHTKMVAARWSSEFARSLTRAALVALARVHGNLRHTITVNGSGMNKSTLLVMLEPYFERMRATLPRLQRVTAGVSAMRLVEE